ncbi:hypothetical protein GNI_142510 [Gregarina niphandrodes]|uniref:Uncharacterized protein n=1 Tax=Gregarina niphandrodes TaxID=110365 RepID=A0A023B0U4_GRENI|nr:hypothetical protein GNI_142510 [Gregarina niphandrodes]EZG44922.1 hypothetical protein GNI_142510 [Gregarina niphandrodes]|eukprot:XP_011132621.1 hypothetical protein GNI_142510 [Gregarina niphandrodes]
MRVDTRAVAVVTAADSTEPFRITLTRPVGIFGGADVAVGLRLDALTKTENRTRPGVRHSADLYADCGSLLGSRCSNALTRVELDHWLRDPALPAVVGTAVCVATASTQEELQQLTSHITENRKAEDLQKTEERKDALFKELMDKHPPPDAFGEDYESHSHLVLFKELIQNEVPVVYGNYLKLNLLNPMWCKFDLFAPAGYQASVAFVNIRK